ncbi:MAG: hypothetical protein EPO06_10450 [Burkholderiaceae bacterium]|nr:MAG: hypothetical protein EPO06_10450 [Burkholderiaceae bacterium]
MRGAAQLPFKTIYMASTSPMAIELRRILRANADVQFVDAPQDAEAIIEIVNEQRRKEVLSLNAQGRPREYKLLLDINFRVRNNKGQDLAPPGLLQQAREISFSDNQVLAKEAEEALLYNDMQSDLVQQILRRLSNIKTLPAAAK